MIFFNILYEKFFFYFMKTDFLFSFYIFMTNYTMPFLWHFILWFLKNIFHDMNFLDIFYIIWLIVWHYLYTVKWMCDSGKCSHDSHRQHFNAVFRTSKKANNLILGPKTRLMLDVSHWFDLETVERNNGVCLFILWDSDLIWNFGSCSIKI